MKVAERIKQIRKAKSLSQKEVTAAINMGTAQYSRIENGRTDPSISTLEKIAQALGVTLAELFADGGQPTEVNSTDRTLMEKVKLMEALEEKERHTLFTMLDAFVSKKRLKDALSDAIKLA